MTPCACLGPMYGEPYCYCTMKQLGLPLNEPARKIEEERAKKEWEEFVKEFVKDRNET